MLPLELDFLYGGTLGGMRKNKIARAAAAVQVLATHAMWRPLSIFLSLASSGFDHELQLLKFAAR